MFQLEKPGTGSSHYDYMKYNITIFFTLDHAILYWKYSVNVASYFRPSEYLLISNYKKIVTLFFTHFSFISSKETRIPTIIDQT